MSNIYLRILTEKKHRQIKLQRLEKVGIWASGLLVHQINSHKRFLNWNKIFKKKVGTGKAPFFVIRPFCTHHFICLNIGFWYGSFVWKWCLFNRFQFFFAFQKICFKVQVLKPFKISTDFHIKTCWSLKRRAILKIPSTVIEKNLCSLFNTRSVGFKMKPLRKSVFQC